MKKLLAPANFFKSKPATAVLCSRSSTACVRQRRRAWPGFECGSGQYPCQRRDWNVIYRMYRAYLSSCIFWSLAVPVASMAMLDGICDARSDHLRARVCPAEQQACKKLFTPARAGAHGPRKFIARQACSVEGDPCAYALNNTYIHTYSTLAGKHGRNFRLEIGRSHASGLQQRLSIL